MKKIMIFASALLCCACAEKHEFDATGTFEATEITVSAGNTGEILSFSAEEGATIVANEVVGVIDTMQLYLQREMLRQQQTAILSSRPDIQKQVAALREQISKNEREVNRLRKLQEGGAATGKQLDDAEAQLSILRSQLDATLQTLNASTQTINSNALALDLQMRQLEDKLAKCRISSPCAGTVLVKYAEAGEMAVAGRPLMKVADLENMYLRAYFSSEQLSQIQLGQSVKVIADFGGDEQIEYEGRIAWIASESEFTPKGIQTRNSRANLVYATKIAVKNDGRLKIGLYGEVHLK